MIISNLQVNTPNWHKGHTESTQLNALFTLKPEMVTDVIMRLFNDKIETPLSYLLDVGKRKKLVNHILYEWKLQGDHNKAIPVVGTYGDGGSYPGLAGGTIRVDFAERWFDKDDDICGENINYLLKVIEQPEQVGINRWRYVLKLVTADQTSYVPTSLLEVGKEFVKYWTSVEHDSSRDGGTTHFAGLFHMRNVLTTFRKKFSMSGAAMNKVLEVRFTVDDGQGGPRQTFGTWMKYAEFVFWKQFYQEIDRAYWYGRANVNFKDVSTNFKGTSGNAIYEGSGVLEQIAVSTTRPYTALSEQMFRNFFSDMYYQCLDKGPKEYVGFAGREFMNLFDQSMKSALPNYTQIVGDKFVTGTGQDLTLGGQFKTFVGLNGDKITLIHNPAFDNPVYNLQKHPKTGIPVESYRCVFLNWKMNGNGESNVLKVCHEGRELVGGWIKGISSGANNSFGSMTAATPVDGHEYHALSECGVVILDPTNAGQFVLDVDNL